MLDSHPLPPLWLDSRAVAALLEPSALMTALEGTLLAQARGTTSGPVSAALAAAGGAFHAKGAAQLDAAEPNGARYAVFKVNGNFPRNSEERGLPTIQGVILLADASNGTPLAIMDSIEITAQRTAAATALAARRLAPPADGPDERARRVLIVGCGVQGWAHARYLRHALTVEAMECFDLVHERAEALAQRVRDELGLAARAASDLEAAARACGVVVTCTTAESPFLRADWIGAGCFVAAVGADNPSKHELDPALLGRSRVVVDDLEQCAKSGELRHALAAGVIDLDTVAAALHQVISGARTVRTAPEDRVVFDSTGIALEDLAAASLVYERARR